MISSCGRPGVEVKAICGLLALPLTLMSTVDLLDVGAGGEVDPRIGRPRAGEGDRALR